jgi:hypothetical protein
MIHAAPLLALDVETLLSIVVFVIIGLSSVISQILAKQRGGQDKLGQPPPPTPQAGAPPDGLPPRKAKGDSLGDEIADFLRRAAKNVQEMQQQRPPQGRQRQAAAQPRPAQNRVPSPRPPVSQRQPSPVQAEIVESARRPVGQGLQQKVAKDIDTSDIVQRVRQLGEETRQATAKLEKGVKDTFDHRLGTLAVQSAATAQKPANTPSQPLPATAAAGFAAMLADAESLKNAIIINEIIQRPTHRW